MSILQRWLSHLASNITTSKTWLDPILTTILGMRLGPGKAFPPCRVPGGQRYATPHPAQRKKGETRQPTRTKSAAVGALQGSSIETENTPRVSSIKEKNQESEKLPYAIKLFGAWVRLGPLWAGAP